MPLKSNLRREIDFLILTSWVTSNSFLSPSLRLLFDIALIPRGRVSLVNEFWFPANVILSREQHLENLEMPYFDSLWIIPWCC